MAKPVVNVTAHSWQGDLLFLLTPRVGYILGVMKYLYRNQLGENGRAPAKQKGDEPGKTAICFDAGNGFIHGLVTFSER
jgi:hypothetical protein